VRYETDLRNASSGKRCREREWEEAKTAGALMGTKVLLNEFLAYLELARLPACIGIFDDRVDCRDTVSFDLFEQGAP
jgi:hypothetical protein